MGILVQNDTFAGCSLDAVTLDDCGAEPRVLFVAPSGEYGGAVSLLRLLEGANGLFQPFVICPPDQPLVEALAQRGIDFETFAFHRPKLTKRPDWYLTATLSLNRIIKRVRPDVLVHNHNGCTAPVVLASRLNRVPVVFIARRAADPSRVRWRDRWLMKRTTGIIAISKSMEQNVREAFPGLKIPVDVLYNPQPDLKLPDHVRETVRSQLGIDENQLLVGTFGRVYDLKRQDLVIRAVALLREQGQSVKLMIVGDGNAAYQKRLNDLVRELALTDAVSFLGCRSDVLSLMAACDVTVLASRTEALGRVLLESWSVGVPVVGSDVEGMGEVIRDSNGGLLFQSGSAEALARQLHGILNDQGLRQEMGERGKRWVRENCGPRAYAERFADIVNRSARR